jgi:hypothetical protein
MEKENVTRDVNVRVHPTLFKQFAKCCKNKYKTVSVVVRELMWEYIEKNKNESRNCE